MREWANKILTFPSTDSTSAESIPPSIPNHYLEEEVQHGNDDLNENIWEKRVTLKPHQTQLNSTQETWSVKRLIHDNYVANTDAMTVQVDASATAAKKHVVVFGGLYLGGPSAIEQPDAIFSQIDTSKTHSVVILGNFFDIMGINAFHELPEDIIKFEERLGAFSQVFDQLKELSQTIPVYYMKGTHDTELPRALLDRLMGDKIVHVSTNRLIFTSQVNSTTTYRITFTSGREWDCLFDDSLDKGKLLAQQPIGCYLSRAAANNAKFNISQLIKLLIDNIPPELSTDFLTQISRRPLQDRLNEMLFQSAFQMRQSKQLQGCKCIISEGKYLSMDNILRYPYIKYLLTKVIPICLSSQLGISHVTRSLTYYRILPTYIQFYY